VRITTNKVKRGLSMTWGKFPVYCETAKEYCQEDDVFLGYHPLSVAVRCPVCNRHTRARRSVNNDQGEKSGKGHGKDRLPTV